MCSRFFCFTYVAVAVHSIVFFAAFFVDDMKEKKEEDGSYVYVQVQYMSDVLFFVALHL